MRRSTAPRFIAATLVGTSPCFTRKKSSRGLERFHRAAGGRRHARQGLSVDVQTFGVRAVVVTSPRVSDTMAYEISRAVFDNFDAFRRLHPAFETLSVADMIRGSGHAPVHAGAYYRERGW